MWCSYECSKIAPPGVQARLSGNFILSQCVQDVDVQNNTPSK